MTTDAMMKLLRALLSFAIGYASAKGYLTPADASAITQFCIEVGPILIPAFLALYSNWNQKSVPQASIAVAPDNVHPASNVVGNVVNVGVAKIVGALLIGFIVLAAASSANAQTVVKKTVSPFVAAAAPCPLIIDPLKLCGVLTGKPQDDIQRVAQRIALITDDDLNYAMAKATAANTNGSAIRKQCLQAIADAHAQATGAGLKKADGSDWPRPDPAAITLIEDIAELVDNLSPQGKLFTSCAGAAQMFKTTTLAAINAIITGTVAIAAAPVGL